ncbi:hypothetical protein DICVIV_08306 [Dictyocaulus viviparus]|uniref:Uncharacterized protein n=1 Tax=Dictyocaulus viviparus TaxID=29172 RepID=A0A0D8XTF0_DICVI|nr:hypothetical protein DICVIV_08306 [Dictyocaulus viviparus]
MEKSSLKVNQKLGLAPNHDSAVISVYQQFGNEEILIWTQSGLTLIGWNRIRLPIRFSPLPSKLLIKTSTTHGQFVAITNTNIVDESGRDLACGGDMLVIRPRNDDLVRLTAMQKLDSYQIESSSIPTLFMVSPSTLAASSAFLSPSLSSPTMNSFSISSPTRVAPSPFATLPISPAQVFTRQHQRSNLGYRAKAFSATSINDNTKITTSNSFNNPQRLPPPILAVTEATPSLEKLLASLSGRPVFDGQLKYLAKKFGLDRLPGDQIVQRYGIIQRMVDELQRNKSSIDKQPITPANIKDTGGSALPLEEVSKLASSVLPSSRTINGALTNRISQLLSPPPDMGDDSKPFSRNSMDFVIENAYNAYINQ